MKLLIIGLRIDVFSRLAVPIGGGGDYFVGVFRRHPCRCYWNILWLEYEIYTKYMCTKQGRFLVLLNTPPLPLILNPIRKGNFYKHFDKEKAIEVKINYLYFREIAISITVTDRTRKHSMKTYILPLAVLNRWCICTFQTTVNQTNSSIYRTSNPINFSLSLSLSL